MEISSPSISDKIRVAVVVTHARGIGPTNYLEAYLVRSFDTVLAIYHPLTSETSAQSVYRLWKHGSLDQSKECRLSNHEILSRIQEAALTLWWTLKLVPRSEVYFGVDAANCVPGIALRVMRRTKKLVFYAIDWSPRRFESKGLNAIYHLLDRVSAFCASETWNVSPAIDRGRWRGRIWSHIGESARKRTKVVEIGIVSGVYDVGKVDRISHRLVFLGHVIKKQGLQLVVEALPQVARKFTDVELIVIGSGPYLATVSDLAESLGISSRVQLLGYIVDEYEVARILRSAVVGLAPYLESRDSFTQFADPGKLKNYLAAGLPIVMTPVPFNADLLESMRCAVLVSGNAKSIADGICDLFAEDAEMQELRRISALRFMEDKDWDSVFCKAMKSLP